MTINNSKEWMASVKSWSENRKIKEAAAHLSLELGYVGDTAIRDAAEMIIIHHLSRILSLATNGPAPEPKKSEK